MLTAAAAGTDRPPNRVDGWLLVLAILWGFAEATFFFVIPDVLLSGIALRRRRLAFVACGLTMAGALAGGAAMHRWGHGAPDSARRFLDRIPAISPAMLEKVASEIDGHGSSAVWIGPIRGVPYKIYAVEAGARGLSLAGFLLTSAPARLLRFALIAALASWIQRRFFPRATVARLRAGWLGVWATVYVVYFSLLGF